MRRALSLTLSLAGTSLRQVWWSSAHKSVRSLPLAQIGGGFGYEPRAHYYGAMRLKFRIAGQKLFAEANYGTDLIFSTLQINARVQFQNNISAFAGYVLNNGIFVGGGYDIYKKLRLNYSITWIRNQLSPVAEFTHEIAFVYQLPFNNEKPIPLNPTIYND